MARAAVSSADILDLAEAIDRSCRTRGFLALPEELTDELLAMRTAQAELRSRVDMDKRILDCLTEYQAQLIERGAPSGWTPALRESWQRFQAAWDAFCHRFEATQREEDLFARVFYRFLRQVRALVDKGVV